MRDVLRPARPQGATVIPLLRDAAELRGGENRVRPPFVYHTQSASGLELSSEHTYVPFSSVNKRDKFRVTVSELSGYGGADYGYTLVTSRVRGSRHWMRPDASRTPPCPRRVQDRTVPGPDLSGHTHIPRPILGWQRCSWRPLKVTVPPSILPHNRTTLTASPIYVR